MKRSTKAMIADSEKAPLRYGWDKADTLLHAIYQSYCEGQGCDSALIRAHFHQLNKVLSPLPLKQQDQVIDLACKLCSAHQKEAYTDGLIAGFHLYRELSLELD